MIKISDLKIYNLILFLRAIILLAPITLLFYQYNGLSASELFFFQGIFYLTSILVEVPVGYFTNNFSKKNLLIISFTTYLMVIITWLLFKGYYVVLIGEIFCAISKVIMDNVVSGYLYDLLQHQDRETKMPKYFGYVNFSLASGTAVAAVVGTFIFSKYGFSTLLTAQALIIITSIFLLSLIPNIKRHMPLKDTFINSLHKFSKTIKAILNNENVKYHISLSGFLTAYSILFVLSFQLLIINTSLPIFIFGLIALTNHGIRALASLFPSHIIKKYNLSQLAKILFALYSIAFLLILATYHTENKILALASMITICFFIGLQLIFTILHISRAHKLVANNQRGSLMSVNNFISRILSAIILLNSKLFMDKQFNFDIYYTILFLIFIIVASYLTYKIKTLKVEQ